MTYKDIAYKILKANKRPLHSKKITQIAIQKGWLKSKGLTPESTMNAQLIRDINSNKLKSRFVNTSPSTFGLNKNIKPQKNIITSKHEMKSMNERFVKDSIIQWLSKNGWGNFKYGDKHEKGVDIKTSRHRFSEHFWIETKGQGKTTQIDYSYFLIALGQIITRMKKIEKTTKYKFGLGLPYTSAKIALRRLPWQVAKTLSLYILSVGQSRNVTQHSWQDLKKLQSQKRNSKK